MDVKHWTIVLKDAGFLAGDGRLIAKPDTILTIHIAGTEVSVKADSDEISIVIDDQVMVVTNSTTGFVQFLPWDGVTKIEQRRSTDHRYRHG
jgi:hypothetical protein